MQNKVESGTLLNRPDPKILKNLENNKLLGHTQINYLNYIF
jgi:hypothetical protein